LLQLVSNQFPFGARRRHLFHKATNFGGEFGVALT